MLALAAAYLVLGGAELLLFIVGRHRWLQAVTAVAFTAFGAVWLGMYWHRRKR